MIPSKQKVLKDFYYDFIELHPFSFSSWSLLYVIETSQLQNFFNLVLKEIPNSICCKFNIKLTLKYGLWVAACLRSDFLPILEVRLQYRLPCLEQMTACSRDLMFTQYPLQTQLSQEQAWHVVSQNKHCSHVCWLY